MCLHVYYSFSTVQTKSNKLRKALFSLAIGIMVSLAVHAQSENN